MGSSERKAIPRPLADSYGISLTVAIVAISLFILVTTADPLYRKQLAHDLHVSLTGLTIISGLATAGYAFGALLGGDFTQRFPQRPLFLVSEAFFILGCLLAAIAWDQIVYGSGLVLLGLATGVLLVAALPPVIQRFPAGKMPITSAVINMGFFGAVTVGPLIGGAVSHWELWRWFYGALALIALVNMAVALFTLPDRPPPNPDLTFDKSAIVLAAAGTVLPFWASGELTGNSFSSYLFTVPLAIGVTSFIGLMVVQYSKEEPLSPVKPMWHTYPLVGVIVAMFGGGAFITFLELIERYQIQVLHRSPLDAGLSFWPQVLGVLVTAALLGLLVRTRFLVILTLAGMFLLIAGGSLLLVLPPEGSQAILLAAIGLLGLGAGATVSPGLWMAGFSLPSKMVGRTFALVELVRSVADYILAPVLLKVAEITSGGKELAFHGFTFAVWITVLITIAVTVIGVALYLAGAGSRLPRADLEGWLGQKGPALQSPAIGEALLQRESDAG